MQPHDVNPFQPSPITRRPGVRSPSAARGWPLVLILGLLCPAGAAPGATITWDGGGGDTRWQTPANWNGDRLPANDDDVVIGSGTAGAIEHAGGTTRIRSLVSARGLRLTGGSLTVTAGESRIDGPLELLGGELEAVGAGTRLRTTGPVTLSGSDLAASQGGVLVLPGLERLEETQMTDLRLRAHDRGSLIDLPGVTTATIREFYDLELTVTDGAEIRLPALRSLNGTLSVHAEDAGSRVDLSGWGDSLVNGTRGNGNLDIRHGAVLHLPNLRHLQGMSLTLRGAATTPLEQLRSARSGLIRLDGYSVSLPALTNLSGCDLEIQGGSRLALPALESLVRTNAADLRIIVADPDSLVDLPNAASSSVADFYHLQLFAYDGGRIRLPRLASFRGGLDLFVEGTDARVELPALASVIRHDGPGLSRFEVRDGGVIDLPNVVGLDRIDVTVRGDGRIPLRQLQSFTHAELQVDGPSWELPALARVTGANLTVEGGAHLVLPGVASLVRTNPASLTYRVNGPGSLLRLPAATSSSVPDYYQLELFVDDGGRIELPRLASMVGSLEVHAEAADSVVDLSGFVGEIADVSPGRSSLEARTGARLLMPGVTRLRRFDVTVRGTGQVPLSQLDALRDGELRLVGASATLPGLTNIDGTNLDGSEGARLELPGVTSLTQSASRHVDFTATDAGTVLRLPQLRAATLPDFYQLELYAYHGGRIELPLLGRLEGGLDVLSSGEGSVVDLSGWTGSLAAPPRNAVALEARDGGAVAIPGLTSLDKVSLTLRRAGTLTTAQLTAITGSRVTVDAANAVFGALADTTGTTFEYLNGGTASFPTPADLVVSDLRAPAVIQAPQAVDIVWEITNRGTPLQDRTWSDAVFLSSDAAPGHDRLLGTFVSRGTLPAAGSLRFTNQVLIPADLAGTWRFMVEANRDRLVFEGTNTANNTSVAATATEVRAPDLVIESPVLDPEPATLGRPATLRWTVRNAGTATAAGEWLEVLSLRPPAGSPLPTTALHSHTASIPLAPGATVTRSVDLDLPLPSGFPAGTHDLVARIDPRDSVAEGRETNNVTTRAVTLALPPLPDLRVFAVEAPAEGLGGTSLLVTWRTGNPGPGHARAPWTERVILAANSGPPRTRVLSSLEATEDLPAGGMLARSAQALLPSDLAAGSYTLTVVTDAEGSVYEGNEADNSAPAPRPLVVPAVLQWQLPVSEIAENARPSDVPALLTRNGDLSVPLVANLSATPPGELAVPASVTFPAGQATVAVSLRVLADGIPDADTPTTVQATAGNYRPASASLTVRNTDLPRLSLRLASATLAEGQTMAATVTRDGPNLSALVVNVATASGSQLLVPSSVTIPAGREAVAFTVLAQDDTLVESARTARLEVSSPGTTGAEAVLTISDDDLPAFTLELADATVSEAEGVAATSATVSRGAPSPRSLTVTLDGGPSSLVLLPANVVIPAGQTSVSFPIAVVDDIQANGPRTATLRASALATSSDTVVATTEPVILTVTDDDGPALQASTDRDVVAEGVAGASTLTVSRNTAGEAPLTVTLASSLPSEATVPPAAIIPAGTNLVRVPITTLDDDRVDGSRTVRITATAPGHAAAETSLTVTDLPYPDLVVPFVTGPESAATDGSINVAYRVLNQGLAPAGTNWVTRLFLSSDATAGDDTLLAEYGFGGTLPVGQYFAQSRQIRLPSVPGDYWFVAVTDVSDQITEVLEHNNTTVSARPIRVEAAYRAVVEAEPAVAPAGTPITLRGMALRGDTGGPAPFVLVNLHLSVRGTRRTISALTDELGRFSTPFQPLPGEAGIYEVGASHPGVSTAPAQDGFVLYGLAADETAPFTVRERDSLSGQLRLRNPGDAPLKGLQVTVVSNLAGVQVTASLPPGGTLGGLAEAPLGFALTAADGSAGRGTVVLRVTSTEGATLDLPLAVVVTPDEPLLEVRPVELIGGVRPGGQTLVNFEVVNSGGSASGPVHVALPPELPWIATATPNPMASIAPGETHRVTLQLRPGSEVPLGEYNGALLLASTARSARVPFRFRVLSEARGDLRVTAVDQYTYYAEGSPKVAGAEVTIVDAISEQVVTNGVTDATGQFLARQLPEGWYDVRLRADRHAAFRESSLVVAGFETNVLAFLSREAVRYLWTVVPTEIEDRTRISIETVFEAFVPMPVVTIEPAVIDLADYTADLTQIELRITNHGLVAAQKARLFFGDHPDWSFEPLIDELGTLPARSTLTVPLLVRKLGTGGLLQLRSSSLRLASRVAPHAGGGGCGVAGGLTFELPCGAGTIGGGAGVAIVNAGSGCGGGGGGGFPGGSGGGGGGSGGAPGGGGGSSAGVRSCDPCLLAILNCLLEIVLPDVLDCAKDLYGCAKHSNEDFSLDAAWDCTKAGLTCAEMLGAELSKLNKAIDAVECIQDLAKSCGSPPGGGGGGGGGGDGESGSLHGLARVARSPSLHAGLSSRVERAELTILRQRADWLTREMAPIRYLLGSDAWLGDPQPVGAQVFLSAFLARIEPHTADGIRIAAPEADSLLATPVPVSVSPALVRAFVDRWNRSVDYWTAGIFQASRLTPGMNPDFIAMDTLRDLSRGQIEADAESVAAGFRSPSDAFNRAAADILRFLGEGDSGGVCAHVRLRLDQDLVATRDAFDAILEIENALGDPLEQVAVDVQVRRRDGQASTGVFVVQAPVVEVLSAVDGTGTLAGGTTGKARWRLIPTPDAAPEGPVEYLVGGQLRYRQGGLSVTVPLAPATITVHPSPSLAVKYFHQRDVFADDPFTTAIEPSVPYSLAVMVQNKGRGAAHHVRIASAQPRIVENEKGLLADFRIIATEVAGRNLQPSLTVDFGTIDPGTNAIGRWLFTSSILGGFLEYSATVEHRNDLGDARLSLVEGVEIHELIHIVRAVGARDDGRPDFLVNDVADLLDYPDTLHSSDGTREPVATVLDGVFDGSPAPGRLEINLTASVPPGWVYLRLPDPGADRFQLTKVVRSDGVEVPFGENAWTTDRSFLGNARRPVVEHHLHLFDRDSTGRYRLVYAARPAGDDQAPVSQVAALPIENSAVFAVTWDGTDNDGGSGVAFFDVYASVDDQPFALWQRETLDRSATYQGALGHTYRFYSVATDVAGNRETVPATPDAHTRVTRVNQAPTLDPIPDQVVREGATLTLRPTARDPDGDALVFAIQDGLPPGLIVHPYTGVLTWVTGEGSGPASHRVELRVLDNGTPRLGAVRSFIVAVSDDNSPPILDPIASVSLRESESLVVTNRATDPDRPAQTLTFSLGPGAPTGVTIDPSTGVLRWTPSSSQGGSTYPIEVIVRDSGSPALTARRVFQVSVTDSRTDFGVTLGTTHRLAEEPGVLSLQLTSGPDLYQVDLELELDGDHVVDPELEPVLEEVVLAGWEALGPRRYRLQLDLATTGLVERTRTIARLHFGTRTTGRSGIDTFGISNLSGLRLGGEITRRAFGRPGRVFVVENEPLLDAGPGEGGAWVLTVVGRDGETYQLQRASTLGIGPAWIADQAVRLTGRTQDLAMPPATVGSGYYRLIRP